ncbi:hypothetical protein LZ30DRAFT_601439 [Colletotrichum cereale]|nr:hypothetical protein LZ30DRAFT_601439 [Colletotrichum cereale]
MDAEPAETAAAAPPDQEAHPGARTSAPNVWIDFSLLDDGLDAPRAAALVPDALPRFHRFPDLPPEIRLKVWSYLVAPRVVTAYCSERDDDDHHHHRRPSLSSAPVFNPTCPVILLVCHESRALGLAHYELAFAWRVPALLSGAASPPVARPPRAWFNFRLDALHLAGALDARDRYGFDAPFVPFLCPRDARRVRRLACAFAALRYPERGPDSAFGCLWHVVVRFPLARRLVLAFTPRDEHLMRPHPRPGAADDDGNGDGDDPVQQLWSGWARGTTVTTARVSNTQVLLVREADLADVMASHAHEDEAERRGPRQATV